MTGLAQSVSADPTEANDSAQPPQHPDRRPPRRFAAIGGWPGIGELTCGVAVGAAVGWFALFGPGESGSRAEWLFGAGACVAVVVALWQTLRIQRQAAQNAAESAGRLRRELLVAEQRAARELALTQSLHRAEMEAQQTLHQAELDAQQTLHRVEMEAQRELAHVERSQLRNQVQKQALIEVSRAVGAHTRMLATLWDQGARVLRIEDRDEREQAMNPIFEQIGQAVNDFSVELDNAHLLIKDDRLQHALSRVNEAALMAIRVAEDLHIAVVEGHSPERNPFPPAQRLLHARAAEARRLAWELLRTGLDDRAGVGDPLDDDTGLDDRTAADDGGAPHVNRA